jgi:hypothetical protein
MDWKLCLKITDLRTKFTFCTISLFINPRSGVEAVSGFNLVSRSRPGQSKSVIVSDYLRNTRVHGNKASVWGTNVFLGSSES